MSSTFEKLPDEILMIIFKYSGDVVTVLRTFLGLNQRLNKILIDKRLHLLTNFLHINVRDDYYNSRIFQQVSEQLLFINTNIDEQKLFQLLQPLLSFHLKQKYIQLGREFQSSLEKFQSIRRQHTNDEILKIDQELKTQVDSLYDTPITVQSIKRIKSLVLIKGACYNADDYELCRFNLTKAVNERFLSYINDTKSKTSVSITSFLQLFKTLIVSNTSLLKNRDYVGNGGCNLKYFLIYTIFRLRYFYHGLSSMPVNMEYYRATVDLLLFVMQCQEQMFKNEHQIRENIFDVLALVSENNNDIFIQTAQWEILKIVVDEYVIKANEPWDDYLRHTFGRLLRQLFENSRLDIIVYIYHHMEFRSFFHEPIHVRECIDLMTRNRAGRRFFCKVMDEKSLDLLFSKKDLIFILLDKKERKLLEKVLKLSPCLVHQLDEDGNDPLLYICLKVYGCRHRIIEFLIKMGSDLERRNFQGQNFMDTLQLQRNQKLLQRLAEEEII